MPAPDSFRPSMPLGEVRRPTSAAGQGVPPLPESGPMALLPGLWVLRHYRREWLAHDVVAGVVLSSMLVPAGIGYAVASGLPPITGLYATVLPLLAYAVFGPSRIMVLGPDSGLVPLVAAAVIGSSAGDPRRAVALAAMLAIFTGLFCVLAGVLKAGFLTDLLSKPVRVGYMNGIALTLLAIQLPKLLGFPSRGHRLFDGVQSTWVGLTSGQVNVAAAAIGAGCLTIIFGLRALAPKAPGILVAVVFATLAVVVFELEHRVQVVGAVPRGVPMPALPAIGLADVGPLCVAAVGTALVSFADTSVLSRIYAARHGYRVDANRELVGLGLANLAGGLFQGFPISSSASRTPVAESAGARTQLTGVVGALVIVVLLSAAPSLMRPLPTTALSAVVIAAAVRTFDLRALRVFAFVRRSDLLLSLIAFLAVATLGVIPGIGVAVTVSILDFVRRAWRPHDAVLGRAEGLKGYHDVQRHPEAREIPGLLLFRWDAPLFFANADVFRARVIKLVDEARTPVRWVVIAAEPITDVDTTAAEMIQELDLELEMRGADLAFAEMKGPVKDRLQRYGLKKRIGHDHFFPTIGVAVRTYRQQFPVNFVDWEEE
jgi:high affinity sulfate transporter 1